MKVMAIPDLHAWPTTDVRPGEQNRREEWLEVTRFLVELASRHDVDLAVAPGDFFVNSRPSAQAIIDMNNFFSALENDAGIPVVGISGNHDSAGSQTGPVDILAELATTRWGTTSLVEYQLDFPGGKIVQVVCLPWIPPGRLASTYGDLKGMLTEALKMVEKNRDRVTYSILIGHWAVKGCVTSNGTRIIDQEPVLELEDLYKIPVDAVILGHIHKPQVFHGPIPILHTGALLRNSFVEEPDDRVVYIIDLAMKRITVHPIPARRYFTYRPTEEELKSNCYSCPPEAEDAICRVVYATTEEVHKQVDVKALVKAVMERNPHHFAGVYPQVEISHRLRAEKLTEHASSIDALKQWLDLQPGVSDQIKNEVLETAKEILVLFD